jgi:hypothetical protein
MLAEPRPIGKGVALRPGARRDPRARLCSRYPDVPRVVVNEDLASHFADNDHILAIVRDR